MKTIRSKTGPFSERPYYARRDVEHVCLQELKAAKLLPSDPEPIRIERFIEKRFGIRPSYEPVPDGILGFSKFGRRGVEVIVVSRALADDLSAAAERRVNTTLAHEAGHALLHSHLFVLGNEPGLFGEGVTGPKILCRDDAQPGRFQKYDGRWWEFQANLAIGALLLPAPLVEKALQSRLTARGLFKLSTTFPDSERPKAVAEIARIFEVNPVVARIRIDELYPAGNEQLTL
jgi:hypothetical protein